MVKVLTKKIGAGPAKAASSGYKLADGACKVKAGMTGGNASQCKD